MYDQNSVLIAAVLFVSMLLVIETGYRLGCRWQNRSTEPTKAQINAIQASLLGVLALLLGFTFSMAMQRYDARGQAVVEEANAIGTTWLRAALLAEPARARSQQLLAEYTDLRVAAGGVDMAQPARRAELLARGEALQSALWAQAVAATAVDDRMTTTGLYIQSLNQMIDAYGLRDAALDRHVPETVLFLLYIAFLLAGLVLGFGSGLAGHRTALASFLLIGLIVILVFVIVDLDRPRRGLIQIDQQAMLTLQQTVHAAR